MGGSHTKPGRQKRGQLEAGPGQFEAGGGFPKNFVLTVGLLTEGFQRAPSGLGQASDNYSLGQV